MSIVIGCDHAGFSYKEAIKKEFSTKFEFKDLGTHSKESVDYPIVAHSLSKLVSTGKFSIGILICGTANGVAMVANKYHNIRAAVAWCREVAQLGRSHNHANILCLPARHMTLAEAKECFHVFLKTQPLPERHERRVKQITLY